MPETLSQSHLETLTAALLSLPSMWLPTLPQPYDAAEPPSPVPACLPQASPSLLSSLHPSQLLSACLRSLPLLVSTVPRYAVTGVSSLMAAAPSGSPGLPD